LKLSAGTLSLDGCSLPLTGAALQRQAGILDERPAQACIRKRRHYYQGSNKKYKGSDAMAKSDARDKAKASDASGSGCPEDAPIGALLRQAAAAQRLNIWRLLSDLGITPPQFDVLTLIKANPGIAGADLARKTSLTPQTISLILANLLRDGHVAREIGAGTGRAQRVSLSPSGEKRLEQSRARIEAHDAKLLAGLKPKRERAIRKWLAAVAARAKSPGAGDDESNPA
jgi:DNA-binding MarR family transcriptional regulator